MIVELGVLAALFALLRWSFTRFARLPEPAYRSPVLLAALFRHPRALLATFAPSLPLMFFQHRLSWASLAPAPWLRPLVIFLAVSVAAGVVLHRKNRYYHRLHLFDRLLLAALTVGTALHPVLAAPLVGLAFVMTWQRLLPLAPDPGALDFLIHKNLALYFLIAFVSAEYIALFSPALPSRFLLFVLALQSASYFYSAVDKLRLRWLSRNELVGLLTAGVAHDHWSSPRRLAAWLLRLNRPLLLLTLMMELSAVLWCSHFWVAALGLAAAVLFHGVVYLVSGMNFLAWVLLDLALAAIAVYTRDPQVFGWRGMLAAAALVAAAPWLFAPLRLAWLDARLCNVYRFETRRRDGAVQSISPAGFAPYEDLFNAGKFRYLSNEKLLVNAWAETGPLLARAIAAAESAEELTRAAERLGRNYYDPRRANLMHGFLREIFAHTDVERVIIRLRKIWFDGRDFQIIEDKVICELEMDADQQLIGDALD